MGDGCCIDVLPIVRLMGAAQCGARTIGRRGNTLRGIQVGDADRENDAEAAWERGARPLLMAACALMAGDADEAFPTCLAAG